MAEFMFSFWMLLKRDWTTYWRDRMKFGAMVFNTLIRTIFIGLLYLNFIPSRDVIASDPISFFRNVQSLVFLEVASTIMQSLYTVALNRIYFIIKFLDSDNFSINKLILKNIPIFHIYSPKY
jgi:hypothetical protein